MFSNIVTIITIIIVTPIFVFEPPTPIICVGYSPAATTSIPRTRRGRAETLVLERTKERPRAYWLDADRFAVEHGHVTEDLGSIGNKGGYVPPQEIERPQEGQVEIRNANVLFSLGAGCKIEPFLFAWQTLSLEWNPPPRHPIEVFWTAWHLPRNGIGRTRRCAPLRIGLLFGQLWPKTRLGGLSHVSDPSPVPRPGKRAPRRFNSAGSRPWMRGLVATAKAQCADWGRLLVFFFGEQARWGTQGRLFAGQDEGGDCKPLEKVILVVNKEDAYCNVDVDAKASNMPVLAFASRDMLQVSAGATAFQ